MNASGIPGLSFFSVVCEVVPKRWQAIVTEYLRRLLCSRLLNGRVSAVSDLRPDRPTYRRGRSNWKLSKLGQSPASVTGC